MLQTSDDAIYIAHGGKKLRYGTHAAPELVLDIDVTKLCDSATGVWIVGLRGYVAHSDGERLNEMPVSGANTIYLDAPHQDAQGGTKEALPSASFSASSAAERASSEGWARPIAMNSASSEGRRK
jgi:hypothetical protein